MGGCGTDCGVAGSHSELIRCFAKVGSTVFPQHSSSALDAYDTTTSTCASARPVDAAHMKRRAFITMIAGSAVALSTRNMNAAKRGSGPVGHMAQLSPPIEQAPTLLSAPIELAGDWGHMLPRSADQVVERMRHACLDGVALVSDRQPTRLRVDEHTSGPPAVWLHPDGSSMAWIIVDIGERDWSQARLPVRPRARPRHGQ